MENLLLSGGNARLLAAYQRWLLLRNLAPKTRYNYVRKKYGAISAIVRKYHLKDSQALYKHAHALGLNGKRAEMEGGR